MSPAPYRQMFWLLILAFAGFTALFTVWPQIDLAVSGAFYSPERGFYLEQSPALTFFRYCAWYLGLALFAVCLFGTARGLWRKRDTFGIPARLWMLGSALYLLGPTVLVNLVLKAYSGRARPAHVQEFGGSADFSAPWVFTDQCAQNCSFVSGEGSLAAASVIFTLLVLWTRRQSLGALQVWAIAGGIVAFGVAAAAQRVVTGRHFLSDTIFAALLMAALALVLHWALRPTQPKDKTP